MTTSRDQIVGLDLGVSPEASVSGAVCLQSEGITVLTFYAMLPTDRRSPYRKPYVEKAGTTVVGSKMYLISRFGYSLVAVACLFGCSDRPSPLPDDPSEIVGATVVTDLPKKRGPELTPLTAADAKALYAVLRDGAVKQDAARSAFVTEDIPWAVAFTVTFDAGDGRAIPIHLDDGLLTWAPPGPRNGINYDVPAAATAILSRYAEPVTD